MTTIGRGAEEDRLGAVVAGATATIGIGRGMAKGGISRKRGAGDTAVVTVIETEASASVRRTP